MALAPITGLLTDIGFVPLPGAQTRIVLTLNEPAFSGTFGQRIISAVPRGFDTTSDTGYFAGEVESTDAMQGDRWYWVSIESAWPDAFGENGMTRVEHLDVKLRIPVDGGNIGQLISIPGNDLMVWVGETNNTAYRFWFRPSTQDLWEN